MYGERREPEFSTELLQPQNAGFGGAEHHDGVEGGVVDALVEDIDDEEHVEVAVAQLFERAGSGRPPDRCCPVWTDAARTRRCRK